MALALLVSTAALLCPQFSRIAHQPLRVNTPPLRAAVHLEQGRSSEDADTAWPQPASTVSELQQEQVKAKEAAEAAALASPSPFKMEDGGFSVVALLTVVVFVAGGTLFFQGISGGGALRFADDQPPEVRACLQRAATRNEASACLPPVPL